MRNGYKVYDSDTHIEPSADTLEKYLSARVRELVPDLESRKVTLNRVSPGNQPYTRIRRAFRLRSASVGGGGADVRRMRGEAEPRTTAPGVSGRFMGSKYPCPGSDDWDVD